MRALRRSTRLAACFLVVLALSLGWPAAPPAQSRAPMEQPVPAAGPRVAYVYNADTASRDSFRALLELRGFQVDTVSLLGAQQFDFRAVQAILIGDDTGDDAHGWLGGTTALSNIASASKYTIGVGLGGAHFFDLLQLEIGRGNTQLGSDSGAAAVNPGDAASARQPWRTSRASASMPSARTRRVASRVGVNPPSVARARRRASAGVAPRATCAAASCSTWNCSSSSSSR